MDPLTMMMLGKTALSLIGGMGGSAQAAAPPPPPVPESSARMMRGGTQYDVPMPTFQPPVGRFAGAEGPKMSSMLPNAMNGPSPGQMPGPANPNLMIDPTAQAAAVLTASGAQPPVTTPVVSKPATAMPDRNGSPMLPMTSGSMDSYYNDPTAAATATPAGGQAPAGLAQSLFSGLQDVQVPQGEAPRPPSPVSPPGPTVRPDMNALMQMITGAGRSTETDPRKAGLAAMLMRG